MNFNIFNKVKKGATWLFGFEPAHAYLSPDEVDWVMNTDISLFDKRNKAKSLIEQC